MYCFSPQESAPVKTTILLAMTHKLKITAAETTGRTIPHLQQSSLLLSSHAHQHKILKISVSISNQVLRIERIPLAKHEVRLTPAEKSVKRKVYVSISGVLDSGSRLWRSVCMRRKCTHAHECKLMVVSHLLYIFESSSISTTRE